MSQRFLFPASARVIEALPYTEVTTAGSSKDLGGGVIDLQGYDGIVAFVGIGSIAGDADSELWVYPRFCATADGTFDIDVPQAENAWFGFLKAPVVVEGEFISRYAIYDEPLQIAHKGIDNLVVYADGVELTITDDYTASEANGTVTIVEGGAVAVGQSISVDYDYPTPWAQRFVVNVDAMPRYMKMYGDLAGEGVDAGAPVGHVACVMLAMPQAG